MRPTSLVLAAALLSSCMRERPGSHARCGGMTYPPAECPPGEECVDVPYDGCDPKRGGADCPTYCVSPRR